MMRDSKPTLSTASRRLHGDTGCLQSPTSVSESMSKAERLLGPSDPMTEQPLANKSADFKGQNMLRRKLSFLGFKVSGLKHSASAMCIRTDAGFDTRRSSPILGFAEDDAVSSVTGRSIHRAGSNSTMRSFYDPKTSPPYVSQQTSASSARDMALRRGYKPVLRSVPQHSDINFELSPLEQTHNRPEKNVLRKRRVPQHIQQVQSPTFRQLQIPEWSLPTPQQTPLSPSNTKFTTKTDTLSSTSARQNVWLGWQSRSAGLPPAPRGLAQISQQASMAPGNNRIAPKLKVRGKEETVENWLEDATAEEQQESKSAIRNNVKGGKPDPPTASAPSPDRSSSSVRTLTSEISEMVEQPQPITSNQVPQPLKKKERTPNSSRTSKMTENDLKIQSVLELSSSEDETDEAPAKLLHQKPVRRSTESMKGEQIVRGPRSRGGSQSSRQYQSSRSISSVSTASIPRSISKMSSTISSRPFSPSESSTPSTPRAQVSSSKWQSDDKGNMGTIYVSGNGTLQSRDEEVIELPITPVQESNRPRMSRVMAVTKEEEELLEAMREKRASMRKANMTEGFKIAIESGLADSPKRPKTAEVDQRASVLFEPDMSAFPCPPGFSSTRIFRNSRGSASIDDLNLHRDAERDDITSILDTYTSFLATSKASSSLSYSPSDFIPSPTTSQGLPLTPPPDQLTPGPFFKDLEASSLSGKGYKIRHNRKRTLSSGMLLLDGVEDRTQEEEEDELAQWAMHTLA